MALNLVITKFNEWRTAIETNAQKSKEAADAATNTTASVKELVEAYKELGDRSGWDTDDFEQAHLFLFECAFR